MGKIFTILFIVIFLVSCKSAKVSGTKVAELPGREIIKLNKGATFDQSVIRATMSIKYKGKADMPNIIAGLRMVKDSIIWLNFSKLGFPVAKLRLTPYKVEFYEKIGRTSFEGDFKLISQWLGTDFDFLKIQNLFLGETLLNLEKQKFQVSIVDDKYELRPKKRNTIFDILYQIDPSHFKIMKEELRHNEKNQNLTILYKDFDKINQSLFPKGFSITAVDERQKTVIDVNYKNVQFDVPLKFPFKIPAGYRNIELE